ncbi:protein hedgehog [Anopheles aquasalis]|uniref:protein hedgehog n=1 Tax=Anopheles aquasalis TaxID=42839 RepID=UPI00215AD3A5|nr:protein hedgehog [Anopheles aquasalis]XP_050088967.1 protein hedgehog [Anopheles aquasalis]
MYRKSGASRPLRRCALCSDRRRVVMTTSAAGEDGQTVTSSSSSGGQQQLLPQPRMMAEVQPVQGRMQSTVVRIGRALPSVLPAKVTATEPQLVSSALVTSRDTDAPTTSTSSVTTTIVTSSSSSSSSSPDSRSTDECPQLTVRVREWPTTTTEMHRGTVRCSSSSERSAAAKRWRQQQQQWRTVLLLAVLALLHLLPAVQSCGPGRGIGGPRRTRKLLPLVFKQHVPNVSENSLSASGMQEGPISRNDSKFRSLETNYNKDIIFKDEEGTGADRVMTQRCKEKLNILAVSVMNQWPGLRLLVTEGWDEDHMHAPESLHYEGRAVDIMTSDKDRSKIGMLARLAVEAGFDWVFYESRNHIHCSVKSDSSQSNHASGCFTGDSTVLTESGTRRRLSELRIGEKVQAIDASGHTVFSEVMMFLDRDTHQRREFVTIEAEGGAVLKVTPAHLVMVWRKDRSETRFVFADLVREGDHVLVHREGVLEPRRVHRIAAMLADGVYAPLTREGTIVVDTIAASCYALIDSQTVAHLSFLPYRVVEKLWSLFERASATDSLSLPRHEGIHWYAKSLYTIKDYLIPPSWLYH